MFIRKKMEQWIKLPRISLFILHFCLLVVNVSNTQVKDVLTLHQLLPYNNNNQCRVSSSVAANKQFNSNNYHSYKNDHLTSYSGYQAVNLHPTVPRNVKRDAKIKRQISNDKFAYNNNRGNLLIKGKKGFKPTAFKSYKVPSSSKTKLKDKSFRLRGNLFRNNVRTTKRPDKDEIESQIVQRSNRDHNLNFDKHWKNAQGGPSQIADHHHLPTSLIFNRNHQRIETTGISKESRINGQEKSRNNLSYLFSEPFAKRSEYVRDANARNDGNSHRYFSRSPRQRYPLDFKDRNKYKTVYRPPHDYRKSYNDNLIKTIKKKYEKILPVVKNIRQSNYYYYYDDDSNGQLLREDEIVSSPFLSLNEANRLKKHDYRENYNNKKLQSITNSKMRNYGDKKFKTLGVNRPSPSNDISHKGSNTRTFPDRSVSYNGFYKPQRRLAYNHYGIIDRIKTALGSVWNFLLSPGTYKYYAEKRYQPDDLSDYYGTFDDDYYYDYYDEANQKGILERFSDIQGAPTTAAAVTAAILPGSLIAIGASLAYYYFNYVWYPTPIVTARLSELIEKFTGREIRSGEESINMSHVVEVLKRIEEDYSRKNAESSSCRNRFVCQIHQEFKEQLEFWGIFVRLFKTDSFSDENTTIFSTPRRFTSESDCESNFSTCKAPFIPLRSILDVFFNQNHKENEIGNYMNT